MKELKIAPGYMITKDGYVINSMGKKTNGHPDKYGRHSIRLYLNGKGKKFAIHRLVASEFLKEKVYNNRGMRIKHLDGNRSNNNVNNLKWVPDKDRNKLRIVIKDIDLREGDFITTDMLNEWIKNGTIKNVREYDNYYIHNKGFIISKKNNKILQTFMGNRGYYRIQLINGKKGKKKFIMHVLVAGHFLKEQLYYIPGMIIRHKDGDKTNDDYKNLKWESDLDRSTRKIVIPGTDLKEGDFINNDTLNKWLNDDDVRMSDDYPDHYIHRYGFIISKRTNRIMSTFKVGTYYAINIYSILYNRIYSLRIHRLVAETFVEGRSKDRDVVNHLDGNPVNNRWDNLEWTDTRGNIQHAIRTGLTKSNNKIIFKDLKNDIERTLLSLNDASKITGISNNTILQRVRYSYKYPIIDRYIIKLLDEQKFLNNNINKHTQYIFHIYDHINDTNIKLDTINKVIYYTSISDNFLRKFIKAGYGYLAGFSIGVNKEYVNKVISKEKAVTDRDLHGKSRKNM